MEMIYLAIGAIVGAAVAWFAGRSKSAADAAMLEAERKERAALQKRLEEAQAEAKRQLDEAREEARRQMDEVREEARRQMDGAREEARRQLGEAREEAKLQLDEAKAEARRLLDEERAGRRADKEQFERQATAARREAEEQRTREIGELQQRYDMLLKQFRTEVTAATEKMLKERSGELQEANTQRMDELFRPIKDNIQRMEQSISEARVATAKSTTHLEDAFRQMMEKTEQFGNEASRLSTALQRKNKVAGNWGELILTELLESQGLQAGVHFDVQRAYKDDETGTTKIPDVVLHLADNRDVIVDSKMSLTAFVDYQNADDERQREAALDRHLLSVREHIRELADKAYTRVIAKPRVSAGFVIMFVPVEGALQLALSAAPGLWREAFDKRVFIAGGQTLMAALRIIDLTWVNVLQERNTQNVMDEARKLVNRVASFYDKFKDLGKKLGEAAQAYEAADQRVCTGKQSILAMGNHLEDLGVRGKKALERVAASEEEVAEGGLA